MKVTDSPTLLTARVFNTASMGDLETSINSKLRENGFTKLADKVVVGQALVLFFDIPNPDYVPPPETQNENQGKEKTGESS